MILTLFGFAKTGKTTFFNLLTDQNQSVSKFSASTNEYHKAMVDVPDQRLEQLADFNQTPAVHAKIEYLDAGAISFGDVKNVTFIDLLRRADGLVHIVRGFEDAEILHANETIDPQRDIKEIEEELRAADFLTIEKRIEKIKFDLGKMKSKELLDELELLTRLKTQLEQEKPLRELDYSEHEQVILSGFKFLSIKPVLIIINCDENSYQKFLDMQVPGETKFMTRVYCGKIEAELLELEQEEQQEFAREYGLEEYIYAKKSFVNASYDLMNLCSFFTIGKNEAKAWTITKGDNAWTAAGKIHSDIQQGFIRAEVINWQDFLICQGFAKAKDKGSLRLEGKTYLVQDGDVIQFRFNK